VHYLRPRRDYDAISITFALINGFILWKWNHTTVSRGIKVAAISLAATVDCVCIEPIVSCQNIVQRSFASFAYRRIVCIKKFTIRKSNTSAHDREDSTRIPITSGNRTFKTTSWIHEHLKVPVLW